MSAPRRAASRVRSVRASKRRSLLSLRRDAIASSTPDKSMMTGILSDVERSAIAAARSGAIFAASGEAPPPATCAAEEVAMAAIMSGMRAVRCVTGEAPNCRRTLLRERAGSFDPYRRPGAWRAKRD
jgi:hypothetical protein